MKKFKRRSARANLQHFRVLTARYFRQIFTNLGVLLPLILEAPVMLLILRLVCQTDAFTAKNIAQANVIIFVLIVMAAFMGILNSYREICKERDVLAREVFGGLDVSAYVLSKIAVLSAIGAVQSALLFGGSLLFIDFSFPHPLSAYPLCFLAMILTNISVTALGLLVSALLKKSESAILPVLLIIIVQVVFSDCLIEVGGADFIKYITPSYWGISVFGNVVGINGWVAGYSKTMNDIHPLFSLGALLLFAFLCVVLATMKLRREFRQKD